MSKVRIIAMVGMLLLQSTNALAEETDQTLIDLVNGDYLRAIPVLTQRAENGDADAQYQLAYMYVTGSGTNVNTAKGMTLFKAAANQGHRDAASQLRLLELRYGKTTTQ